MKTQIKVTPHDIENRIQTTEQPNGEKFVADWTWEFQKKIGYHGSPMGRGHTGDAAIADLIRRTNMELGSCELVFSNVPIKSKGRNADRRALKMGANDTKLNNVDPEYRGKVEVNGITLDVINSATFNGIIHWGLCGQQDGEAVIGWIPACLCDIPGI